MRYFSACVCLLLSLMVAAAGTASAQVNSVNLSGTVLDPTGATVKGARVTVKNLATGAERSGTSDEAGHYEMVGLPPGRYSLGVEASGFSKFEQEIVLTLGVAAEFDPRLSVQAQSATVNVEAQPELIETSKTDLSSSITQTQIDNLPINGRNYINFTLLNSQANRDSAPSIGAAPTSGLNFGGQRARSNEVSVDGADAVDNSINGVRSTVSQEAVQEFQLITNNYLPEYGRATGGVVNIVTRSGGNDTHGDVFGYLRHSSIQARNPFSVTGSFNPATDAVTLTPVKQPYTRVQGGATIGGPIQKDKTFYFFSYEITRRQETGFSDIGANTFGLAPVVVPCLGATPVLMTPTQGTFYASNCGAGAPAGLVAAAGATALSSATALFGNAAGGPTTFPTNVPLPGSYVPLVSLIGNFPTKEATSLYSLRLDHIWSSANSSFVRASVSPSLITGIQVNAQNQNFGENAGSRTSLQQARDLSIVGQHVTNFSATVFNEARFQFARRGLHYGFSQLPGGSNVGVNIIGFAFFGREPFSTVDRIERRNQWADNITWTKGSHTFKFGGDYNLIQVRSNTNQIFELDYGGRYDFSGLCASCLGFPSTFPGFSAVQAYGLGIPGDFIQGIGSSARPFDNKPLGVFAQDSWKIGSRFTLNYGVRYDIEWTPRFKPSGPFNPAAEPALGVIEGIPVDSDNVQPRIGFAWDPLGDHKTVIRAGYGLFYDHPLLAVAFDSTTADGALSSQLIFAPGTPSNTDFTTDPAALNASSIFQGILNPGPLAPLVGYQATSSNGTPNPQRFDPLLPNSLFINQNFLTAGVPLTILPFTFPVAKNFEYAYAQQGNLVFERELSKDFKISLAYTYNRGLHLNRARNINAVIDPLLVQNDINAITAGVVPAGTNPLLVQVPLNGGAPGCVMTSGSTSILVAVPGILGTGFTSGDCTTGPIGPVGTAAVFNYFRPSGPNPSFGVPAIGGYPGLVAIAGSAGFPTGFPVATCPATLATCIPVPWSDVVQQESSGNSVYHGFTLTLQKRFSNHFQLLSNWTYSHAIDDSTDLQSLLEPQDNRFPNLERGNSTFDQRHRWVTSAVFQSPYKSSDEGFLKKFLANFTMSPIFDVSTGRPFTVLTGIDANMDFSSTTDRPSVVPAGTPGSTASPFIRGAAFFPPTFCPGVPASALVPSPPLGCTGNLARNAFYRPGFFTIDLRLSRKFYVGERWNVEVIGDGFNMLNRFNVSDVNLLCDPTSGTGSCNAGQPTAALDPRQFQFALKLNW